MAVRKNFMANNNNYEKLVVDDTVYETKLTSKYKNRKAYIPNDPKKLNASIPGVVQDVFIKKGDVIEKGEKLFMLEAMKMKNTITAPLSGRVKVIYVSKGKLVAKGEPLIELE